MAAGMAGAAIAPALVVAVLAYALFAREQELRAEVAELRQLAEQARARAETCSPERRVGHFQDLLDQERLIYRRTSTHFVMVTDLDKASRHPQQLSWHALAKRGVLHAEPSPGGVRYRLEWLDEVRLESGLAAKNRSMELSELIWYDGRLLAMCDITGLVFEVDLPKGRAIPRWVLPDGKGDDTAKPFKSEWATVKDGVLLIGSMGREWVREDGSIESYNNQWIKSIDRDGRVESIDWRPVYEALRSRGNATLPGYLWHEAVLWDPRARRWLVLPRKASEHEPYTPSSDETRGTNLLLLASADFSDIEVRRIGPLEPEYGFTSVRKVPGTEDTFMALKVLEVGSRTETKITVFDLDGNFLLDPPFQQVASAKYEGLSFLPG